MPNKQLQLFLLPYAGGSIAAFKRLTGCIDERIECITVEYPGRGSRARDPLAESFRALLDDAADYCMQRRNMNLPFAVLGYSMGSILAYELLEQGLIPGELKHFFICAEVSPKERSLELRKVKDPTDERILERAKQLGGLDERMVANKRFADIYLKPMLSDYRLIFSYSYGDADRDSVSADATVFYCERDTALKDVLKWEELVCGSFVYHELGDNHFFVNQHAQDMADVINNTLSPYLAGNDYDVR